MTAPVTSGRPPHKEEVKVVKIGNPYIFIRRDRKYYYVRYDVFFDNGTVKTFEESTKVGKHEKNKKFMQTKFLPAWLLKKQEELSIAKPELQVRNFDYYARLYLDSCSNLEDYQQIGYRVKRLMRQFGKNQIDKITKSDIKHYLQKLTDKNGKPLNIRTVKKLKTALRGIFQEAVDDGVLDSNPVDGLKINYKKTATDPNEVRPFEAKEVQCLLERAKSGKYGEYMYDYLCIAFSEGMSPSEILGLQIKDVDLVDKTISMVRDISKGKIKATKNAYRRRTIPIMGMAEEALRRLIAKAEAKGTPWLFSDKNGNYIYDVDTIRGNRALYKNGKVVKKSCKWYKLLEDCDIEYRHLKNARHTFAVRMIELSRFPEHNITLQLIARLMGHSSLKMIYEHYGKWIHGGQKIGLDPSFNIYESSQV